MADTAELLERNGHTVEVLQRSSDSAGRGRGRAAVGLLGGGLDPGEVGAAARRLGADVVHAHNVHPLFGWRALAAGRAAGARTVLHLHNFRLFCAVAVAYRDGAPCFRCQGRNTLPGLRLRCRGSLAEAAVYAAGLSSQQSRLLEHADRLVAVGQAQAERLRSLGAPGDRISTLPNFIPAVRFAAASAADQGSYALCSGRLVEEKGFDTAIGACRAAGVPLVVAGEGPDEARLRGLADGAEVTFTGRLTAEELAARRRAAAIVLAPSRWEEPCPYSVLEAHADGVPVLAARRGGLPELVEDELAVEPDDGPAWAAALGELWRDPARRSQLGEQALQRTRERHGEEGYLALLLALYAG